MYFKCEWCGSVAENPEYFYDKENGWGGYPCPCGNTYEEAKYQCEFCGDYFTEEETNSEFISICDGGKGFCLDCLKKSFTVEIGKKYIKKFEGGFDLFIIWILPVTYPEWIKRAVRQWLESDMSNDCESIKTELWEYVSSDIGHFAKYIYDEQKGGDNK